MSQPPYNYYFPQMKENMRNASKVRPNFPLLSSLATVPLNPILLTLIYTAVGLQDTHCFKGYYLQKFLSREVVKKLIFLVQSIVYLAMLSNLWINVDFIRYLANYFFSSEIECSTVTQGGRVVAGDTQPVLSASPLSWVIRSGVVEKTFLYVIKLHQIICKVHK